MTHKVAEPVQSALVELVAYLEGTADGDGPDRSLARSAAESIRNTIAALARATDPAALRAGFKRASYDVSARGIFEWAWSPETEMRLREHATGIGRILDRADRRVRRHMGAP